MGKFGDIAKQVILPEIQKNNAVENNGKIYRAYVYDKTDLTKNPAVTSIFLHLVLAKSGKIDLGAGDFMAKCKEAFGLPLRFHMSYKNEQGPISSPPGNAELFFSQEDPS